MLRQAPRASAQGTPLLLLVQGLSLLPPQLQVIARFNQQDDQDAPLDQIDFSLTGLLSPSDGQEKSGIENGVSTGRTLAEFTLGLLFVFFTLLLSVLQGRG